jgi:hypothetical protein
MMSLALYLEVYNALEQCTLKCIMSLSRVLGVFYMNLSRVSVNELELIS